MAANEYRMLEFSEDIFEPGPMSHVSADSFEYSVEQA
jgi:hypothetical protein